MERKGLVYIVVASLVVLGLAGCETVPKKFKAEVAGIKSKVDTLETRVEGVETKQAESDRMAAEQIQALEEMRAKAASARMAKTNISTKPRVVRLKGHMKEIQICLKNAGFYNGKIDGVKGRNTKKAIKAFQRANGLKPDGVVGPKTWELLTKYSSSPAEGATGGPEEEPTK